MGFLANIDVEKAVLQRKFELLWTFLLYMEMCVASYDYFSEGVLKCPISLCKIKRKQERTMGLFVWGVGSS